MIGRVLLIIKNLKEIEMDQINQNMQQQPPRHVTNTQVSAKEFAAKFKSKRECYNFLAGDCECYLPPYGESSLYYYL